MSDESEIRDVIKAEKKRLNPAGAEAARKHLTLTRKIRKLLEEGVEEDLIDYLRSIGMREGSPGWLRALAVWRENRF